MHITTAPQINDSYKTDGFNNKYVVKTNVFIKDKPLINLPNYNYQINFQGAYIRTIEQMQKLVKSKNYQYAELKKLFENLSNIAKRNITEVFENLKNDGLTFEAFLPCAVAERLFYKKSKTVIRNVRDFVERFKNEGLSTNAYIIACGRHTALYTQVPKTTEKNMRTLAEIFKNEGLTVKDIIKAGLKQPNLFSMAPKSIERKLRAFVRTFEKEGLTMADYINACKKQPSLFSNSPRTIEKNIRGVVKIFKKEGLTTANYINTCIKQPSLFTQSPQNIVEHIRAYMYIDKNKLGYQDKAIMQKVMKKVLSYSTSSIYLRYLILPQLKAQSSEISQWTANGVKPNLKMYFEKNPDKKFTIKVLKDAMTDNFIKTIREYCQKDLGRDDIFNIVVVKKGA